jgi:hypothetical protein
MGFSSLRQEDPTVRRFGPLLRMGGARKSGDLRTIIVEEKQSRSKAGVSAETCGNVQHSFSMFANWRC